MQKPLVGLTRQNFAREVVAGVTLLAIAIPLNIGYEKLRDRLLGHQAPAEQRDSLPGPASEPVPAARSGSEIGAP